MNNFKYDSDIQQNLLFPIYGKTDALIFDVDNWTDCIIITSYSWNAHSSSRKVVWVFAEGVRLKLGQSGNTQERVSKLAGSMLLSFFPQLPALFYFGYYQEIIFTVDSMFSLVLIILLNLELILSLVTIRRFIQRKTRRFYRFCRQEAEEVIKLKEKEEAEVAYWSKCAFDEWRNKEVNF